MLFGRYITKKRRAIIGGCGAADSAGYVVVAGCNIGYQGTEDIKRRTVTNFLLNFHIILYLVERDVAGAFDHNLTAVVPCPLCKLTERS